VKLCHFLKKPYSLKTLVPAATTQASIFFLLFSDRHPCKNLATLLAIVDLLRSRHLPFLAGEHQQQEHHGHRWVPFISATLHPRNRPTIKHDHPGITMSSGDNINLRLLP
jgi:hypothetical protein